ncbi:DNA-binding transcriptional regulator, MarR family [Sinomicrobium oceani]|uniref:DNA-binding transcriptional regulator, MarR family n=1 Tax=Sinomicrobium oceani TaxID=1150368 RepID=A0A1K1PX68_9FLAO|nr:MarR family winged helix-turn-helix transcriptional regulator [Sinomicrobium oceani]SFW52051.1 DNA-binding transcriptional regulator, MarR family [Sinomicrobium oceani]
MGYTFIRHIISLAESYEKSPEYNRYGPGVAGFKKWIYLTEKSAEEPEPYWEGKENGRSAESVINTLLVHLNRYAKTYSKSAIYDSDFSTQEEFIYLINLMAFGPMTKMQLIKKNIQDKSAGMQIIRRLLKYGWVEQKKSADDKRSRVITLTSKGKDTLEQQMNKIRTATNIVTGNLSHPEKMELIRLLDKLDKFHHPIYSENLSAQELLNTVEDKYLPGKN